MGEEEVKKVRFGTEALNKTFEGEIVECRIQAGERSWGDKPPRDQLYVRIKPLGEKEVPEDQYPMAWYSVSYSPNSKWAELQNRLEKMNALPENDDPANLVGKVFEWERVDLEYGKDKESGEVLTSKNVLMPKRYIKNPTAKAGKPAKASSPSVQQKIPEEPKVETKDVMEELNKNISMFTKSTPLPESGIQGDIKTLVMEAVEKEPVVMEKFYKEMEKKGKARAEVFRAVKELQKEDKVKWNAEQQVMTKA